MSEPVRLYHKDGTQFDCVAPSEVVRLVAAGEWRREPWPEPVAPPPADDADEIPFATPLSPDFPDEEAQWAAPLPKRRQQRKPSKERGVL